MRQKFSASPTFISDRSVLNQGSPRTLVAKSMCDLEAAFSRKSRGTGKEVCSILARLQYLADSLAKRKGVALKWGFALFSTEAAVDEDRFVGTHRVSFCHTIRIGVLKLKGERWKKCAEH